MVFESIIKTPDGTYTSLAAWEADAQNTLVEIEVAECHYFSDGLDDKQENVKIWRA